MLFLSLSERHGRFVIRLRVVEGLLCLVECVPTSHAGFKQLVLPVQFDRGCSRRAPSSAARSRSALAPAPVANWGPRVDLHHHLAFIDMLARSNLDRPSGGRKPAAVLWRSERRDLMVATYLIALRHRGHGNRRCLHWHGLHPGTRGWRTAAFSGSHWPPAPQLTAQPILRMRFKNSRVVTCPFFFPDPHNLAWLRAPLGVDVNVRGYLPGRIFCLGG